MENKRIQEENDALNKKIEMILWKAEYERRQKSLPSRESKFKASSAPGQTTLDIEKQTALVSSCEVLVNSDNTLTLTNKQPWYHHVKF